MRRSGDAARLRRPGRLLFDVPDFGHDGITGSREENKDDTAVNASDTMVTPGGIVHRGDDLLCNLWGRVHKGCNV